MRLFVFIGIFLSFISVHANANSYYVVIVNSKNSQKIDKKLIKNIAFDMVSSWVNGQRIRLYFPKVKTTARREFSLSILGINANQDARNWQNKKITNTLNNTMPKFLRDRIIIKMVAKHPNALGYVSPDDLKNNPNIRVLHLK